jgi:hypothetical protein
LSPPSQFERVKTARNISACYRGISHRILHTTCTNILCIFPIQHLKSESQFCVIPVQRSRPRSREFPIPGSLTHVFFLSRHTRPEYSENSLPSQSSLEIFLSLSDCSRVERTKSLVSTLLHHIPRFSTNQKPAYAKSVMRLSDFDHHKIISKDKCPLYFQRFL